MYKKAAVLNKDIYVPKSQKEIQNVSNLLMKMSGSQMKDLWEFGLLVGLRVSELLQIKYSHILVKERQGVNYRILLINPSKRAPNERLTINLAPNAFSIISRLEKEHPNDIYLFQSRRSKNRMNSEAKPITRQAVYKSFNDVGKIVNRKITPHSMRHAFAQKCFSEVLADNMLLQTSTVSESIKMHYIRGEESSKKSD